MKLTVNSKAPTFSAPDQYNKLHSLEAYAGKWLLLYFYPKDDTPGCTAEACGFRDAMSDLLQHITVLGVSADSVASHAQFAQKYHLNFPILADPEKKIHNAYGTNGLIANKRVSFLITPDGIIAKIYDKVNVNTHANDILLAVKHLHNDPPQRKTH
jgi:peroxiredoxin Q/BCP